MRQRLADGLQAMGLVVAEDLQQQLLMYLELLARWNRVYNLTAITDPQLMVTHHLLDSLALRPYIVGERIIDVGTGAGLPGIPLALLAPDQTFVLVDSQAKKTRFIQQAVIALELKNVETVTSRIEAYQPSVGFDVIIARAFGSLQDILQKTQRLARPHAGFVLPKGQYPQSELDALTGEAYRVQVHSLQVPHLHNRHLVCIRAVS